MLFLCVDVIAWCVNVVRLASIAARAVNASPPPDFRWAMENIFRLVAVRKAWPTQLSEERWRCAGVLVGYERRMAVMAAILSCPAFRDYCGSAGRKDRDRGKP